MSLDGSVTGWIDLLKAGDGEAAGPLWQRYFLRLVSYARSMLGRAPRRAADEEDVALSAFDSFCRGAARGHFPRLDDRDDLWRLLLVITGRKAVNQVRGELRARRGGGKVRAEADLRSAEDEAVLAGIIGPEPTPAFAVQMAEEYRRLLDKLGAEDLRSIAVLQMEGHTVEEISVRLGRSERTVARRLQKIRELWCEEDGSN